MSESNTVRRPGPLAEWFLIAAIPTVALSTLLSRRPALAFPEIGAFEPTVLALGWLGATLLCGWLVMSQVLYTLAIATRANWLAEALRPVTLPIVRRVAASLASLAISSATPAALAQTTTYPPSVAAEYTTLRQEATPTPQLQPLLEVDLDPLEADGSYGAPLTWLVRPGDHLWKIAEEHLKIVLDRKPTESEHARYWVEVVEAARPVIRSGDPDLIYPGEEIPLPPTLDAGVRP